MKETRISKQKIIVVDDETRIRDLLRIILESRGFEVIEAKNGQEAVEEAKESLRGAIELILEDRREDIFRGLPKDVIRDTVHRTLLLSIL